MKELLKEKIKMMVVFIGFYLFVEIITFLWVDFSFLPKDILIDLMIAFAISLPILLIRSIRWSQAYLGIWFFLIVLLFMINATMYEVYYDLFTLQQLQLIGEAADVINAELLSWTSIATSVGLLIAYALSSILMVRHLERRRNPITDYYRKSLVAFFSGIIIVFGFFMIDTSSINSFLSDSNVTTFKRASFEKYGMLGYYAKEIEDIIENGDSGYDITPVLLSEPTEYFGALEGKNVISILLESVQPFAINEYLTPNMYMMTQDGLYFENSYCENKTNVSELIGITGNYPTISLFPTDYTYDFSYSIPSVLRSDGYVTTYLHDNVATFYVRGALMPQLGFDNVYLHEELYPGVPIWRWNGDYTLDSVTMEKMLPMFSSTEEPFYTYWASLSTHGPYDYGTANKILFDELGYFDAIDQAEADGLWTNVLAGGDPADVAKIRHYQAAVMDLDVAIGMMLDDLEAKGILDDTIIVMYGDHNVYYHDIYLKMFASTFNDYYNMEMYRNFFVMYNPSLTQLYLDNSGDDDSTISEFVTPYNIVPTLFDLLGIQYNQNLFMGSSIFAEGEDVFYSIKLTAFFNYNMFSTDGVEIIYYKQQYTPEELADFIMKCEELRYKIGYINKWYVETKEAK